MSNLFLRLQLAACPEACGLLLAAWPGACVSHFYIPKLGLGSLRTVCPLPTSWLHAPGSNKAQLFIWDYI